MLTYRIPAGVSADVLQDRPVVRTPAGGKVALDPILLRLWREADGRPLDDIVKSFAAEGATSDVVRVSLACLVEAGLLEREGVAERASGGAAGLRPPSTGPLVSVVIVSYNSRHWLEACLPTLFSQTYSPLEVIVVDNASPHDDTVEWVATRYPQIKLVGLPKSESLARAINEGVAQARGDYYLIANPDLQFEPDAVGQMVAVARQDPGAAAVAAKLRLWWAPSFLNGLGNQVGASSWGSDNGIGHLDLGQFDGWREVPSACFAATLVSRAAWKRVGPVDEGFPMYYEDSEWCYRARLLGYRIAAAPAAVIYHAFGGLVPSGEETPLSPQKLRHVVYGRLRFAAKILDASVLPCFLQNYGCEDWANATNAFRARQWPVVAAYAGAWLSFFAHVPEIVQTRRDLQGRRVCSDDELFSSQATIPAPLTWRDLPVLTWELILRHYLPLFSSGRIQPMPEFEAPSRPHVLIVSNDVVDAKMAGPGMRYLEMARALSQDVDVTLAVPAPTSLEIPSVRLVHYREGQPEGLRILVENSDIAVVSGYMVDKFPFLFTTKARLVVDLYDPFVLENLHYYVDEPMAAQERLNQHAVEVTNKLASLGDFFICGNERQRDFWIGVLAANGRINPRTFAQDPSLKSLLSVVSIGFPDHAPRPAPVLRGAHPAIPTDARIVLWGGGIWNWLDPLSLIRAWPEAIRRHPEARLVFLGTRHPNPLVPKHRVADEAEALAAEIGEKDRSIIFIEWVPYEEREGLLREADIGVTLHPVHVETRYSIRTRVLDYLWARLPILITEGDVTSEWVEQHDLGRVVPPHNPAAIAEALGEMLDRPKESWARAFDPLHETLQWSHVVAPLREYCLKGDYAPDRQRSDSSPAVVPVPALLPQKNRVVLAFQIMRSEGIRSLWRETRQYIRWRLAQL